MAKKKKSSRSKAPKKKLIIAIAAVVVVAGVATYFLTRSKTTTPTSTLPPVSATTKVSPTQPGVTINAGSADSTNPKPSTTNGTTAPTSTVTSPSGTFVSNHYATLSEPANAMNSTCRTNAGATCQINFTQGSTVKTLGPNTVGSDGTISWQWKLQDIGLTTGDWQVQAIATVNGSTSATNDPLSLSISP